MDKPYTCQPSALPTRAWKALYKAREHLYAVWMNYMCWSLFGSGFHLCNLVLMNVMKKMSWLISGIKFSTCISADCIKTLKPTVPSLPSGHVLFSFLAEHWEVIISLQHRFPGLLHLLWKETTSAKSNNLSGAPTHFWQQPVAGV